MRDVSDVLRLRARFFLLTVAAAVSTPLWSAGVQTLDTVEVSADAADPIGRADSSSEGSLTRQQIEARANYRGGELLEGTPGLIVTQHSGEGKANQYFLRGMNLDHGTDLAISVDGMPVNQRTHGHGQGYSDLNFLIPDLVSEMQYRKGPYAAEDGDFSAAGSMQVLLPYRLERSIAEAGVGGLGYRRFLLADAPQAAAGNLMYALEVLRTDGPWTRPDDFRRFNGLLRYADGSTQNGFTVTAMANQGSWHATNQVPKRAVDSGMIGRWDTLDPSDGGESSRYSLSGAWSRTGASSATSANAYLIRSHMQLWSNFTFYQDDPVNGDQFEQRDQRVTTGVHLKHTAFASWGGREIENTYGFQARNDNIKIGLFHSAQRAVISTTRSDHVVESSGAIYYQNGVRWNNWFRTLAGLRGDYYVADVNSDKQANSGRARGELISPKINLVFGPWARTEYYLNAGRGFRSNDARGATITVDPKDPARAAVREPLLVHATGYETGVRSTLVPNLQSAFTLFRLDFQSELLFQGDAGTTSDTGRSSRRVGFEFSNLYTPAAWLSIDADIAYAKARYVGADAAAVGDRVPGAVEGVATLTATVDHQGSYYGSMRVRHFGPRPLVEDNSLRSASTTLVSGRLGYKFDKQTRLQLDMFNLFNRRASQIDYAYSSQLKGEAAPVTDIHFHPAEPRSLRLSLILGF